MNDFRTDPYAALQDARSAFAAAIEQRDASYRYFFDAYQIFVAELYRTKSHFDKISLADMTDEMNQQRRYVDRAIAAVETDMTKLTNPPI